MISCQGFTSGFDAGIILEDKPTTRSSKSSARHDRPTVEKKTRHTENSAKMSNRNAISKKVRRNSNKPLPSLKVCGFATAGVETLHNIVDVTENQCDVKLCVYLILNLYFS